MKKIFLMVLVIALSMMGFSQNIDLKKQYANNEMKASTTIYECGFEFESGTGDWVVYDKDGDGYNWWLNNQFFHNGEKCLVSESSRDGALTPDNWIVSPEINLPEVIEEKIILTYWIAAQDPTWYKEKYSVAISSNGSADYGDFTDTIYAEELPIGNWRQVKIDITQYEKKTIYVAFIHSEVSDVYRLALDDFRIYKGDDTDIEILSISAPTHGNFTSCNLGEAELIKAKIYNKGEKAISNFPITYTINGGEIVSEIVESTINPFDTMEYIFTQTANLSVQGRYNIKVSANISADIDVDVANNTKTYTIDNSDGIIEIHALTDSYASGKGLSLWSVVNTLSNTTVASRNTPWQWNIEVSEKICIYNDSCYVISVVDPDGMSGLSYLEILHDGIQIAGSTTPGSFTSSIQKTNVGNGCPKVEVGIESINQTIARCGLTEVPVIINIKSSGLEESGKLCVQYTVDNGIPVVDTINTSLEPGSSISYTFSTNADVSQSGFHNIVAKINIVDGNMANNTISTIVDNISPFVINETSSYFNNFETTQSLYGLDSINANNDSPYDWDISYHNIGTWLAMYYQSQSNAADDWLIMRCMEFKQGTHNVYFDVMAEQWPGYNTIEKMEVKFGTTPTPEGMSNLIIDMPNIKNTQLAYVAKDFEIPEDGVYFIGFHVYSDPDQFALLLDNIGVRKGSCVSIDENTQKQIVVYPNPCNDIVNIVNAENEKIEIYNIVGKRILSIEKAEMNQKINISNLEDGVYFVKTLNEIHKLNKIK